MKALLLLFICFGSWSCWGVEAGCAQALLRCPQSCSTDYQLLLRVDPCSSCAGDVCDFMRLSPNYCCLMGQRNLPGKTFCLQNYCCAPPNGSGVEQVIANIIAANVSCITNYEPYQKRSVEEVYWRQDSISTTFKRSKNIAEPLKIRKIHKSQSIKSKGSEDMTEENLQEIRNLYKDTYIHPNAIKHTIMDNSEDNPSEKREIHDKRTVNPIISAEKSKAVKISNHLTTEKIDKELSHLFVHYTKKFAAVKSATSSSLRPKISNVENTTDTNSSDIYGDKFVVQEMIRSQVDILSAGVGWNLIRISQRTLPLGTTYSPFNSGISSHNLDVHVYVVDTGVNPDHSAFTDVDVFVDYGGADCHGHGTHVASTVAGRFSGVLANTALSGGQIYNVIIHSIKVLGCDGSGTTFSVISGLLWIYDNAIYPAIVTMSLGASPRSFNLDDVVSLLITDKGIPVIAAAGNANTDACNVSPAGGEDVIAVGSTGITDAKSSFSNWGTCVNVFAPGEDVMGAYYLDNLGYISLSGTSMSTPHFTGDVAAHITINRPISGYTDANTALRCVSFAIGNSTTNQISGSLHSAPNLLAYVGPLDVETPSSPPPPHPLSTSSGSQSGKSTNRILNWTDLIFIIALIFYLSI